MSTTTADKCALTRFNCNSSYNVCLSTSLNKCGCLKQFWGCTEDSFCTNTVVSSQCSLDMRRLRCSDICPELPGREEAGVGWIVALSFMLIALVGLIVAALYVAKERGWHWLVWGKASVAARSLPGSPKLKNPKMEPVMVLPDEQEDVETLVIDKDDYSKNKRSMDDAREFHESDAFGSKASGFAVALQDHAAPTTNIRPATGSPRHIIDRQRREHLGDLADLISSSEEGSDTDDDSKSILKGKKEVTFATAATFNQGDDPLYPRIANQGSEGDGSPRTAALRSAETQLQEMNSASQLLDQEMATLRQQMSDLYGSEKDKLALQLAVGDQHYNYLKDKEAKEAHGLSGYDGFKEDDQGQGSGRSNQGYRVGGSTPRFIGASGGSANGGGKALSNPLPNVFGGGRRGHHPSSREPEQGNWGSPPSASQSLSPDHFKSSSVDHFLELTAQQRGAPTIPLGDAGAGNRSGHFSSPPNSGGGGYPASNSNPYTTNGTSPSAFASPPVQADRFQQEQDKYNPLIDSTLAPAAEQNTGQHSSPQWATSTRYSRNNRQQYQEPQPAVPPPPRVSEQAYQAHYDPSTQNRFTNYGGVNHQVQQPNFMTA